MKTDTIAAIATPPGKGGIGIVRVSGPQVKTIIHSLLDRALQPRTAHYCNFLAEDQSVIDSGLAIYFPGPGSYTGEDILELHAHCSRVVLESLLKRIVRAGARLAVPGEFTQRAFHNDKIDLLQAEAVADLINAVSDQAARSAIRSLSGNFSKAIASLQEELIAIRMFIESALDFPEEEINFINADELEERVKSCIATLQKILARARTGSLLNEGVNIVITGRTNAGKSTLLNRMAGSDVAIVTEEPGTTRDLIERDILIEGVPAHIVDTAGLRITDSRVEMEGIKRARHAAMSADIIILVTEDGKETDQEETALINSLGDNIHIITLHNKIDLSGSKPGIMKKGNSVNIRLSAKTGEGYGLLIDHLKDYLGILDISEDTFMARKRHLDSLGRARLILEDALKAYGDHRAAELLAEDLRQAHRTLGEITGEFVADDLLNRIFSEFCIGK